MGELTPSTVSRRELLWLLGAGGVAALSYLRVQAPSVNIINLPVDLPKPVPFDIESVNTEQGFMRLVEESNRKERSISPMTRYATVMTNNTNFTRFPTLYKEVFPSYLGRVRDEVNFMLGQAQPRLNTSLSVRRLIVLGDGVGINAANQDSGFGFRDSNMGVVIPGGEESVTKSVDNNGVFFPDRSPFYRSDQVTGKGLARETIHGIGHLLGLPDIYGMSVAQINGVVPEGLRRYNSNRLVYDASARTITQDDLMSASVGLRFSEYSAHLLRLREAGGVKSVTNNETFYVPAVFPTSLGISLKSPGGADIDLEDIQLFGTRTYDPHSQIYGKSIVHLYRTDNLADINPLSLFPVEDGRVRVNDSVIYISGRSKSSGLYQLATLDVRDFSLPALRGRTGHVKMRVTAAREDDTRFYDPSPSYS